LVGDVAVAGVAEAAVAAEDVVGNVVAPREPQANPAGAIPYPTLALRRPVLRVREVVGNHPPGALVVDLVGDHADVLGSRQLDPTPNRGDRSKAAARGVGVVVVVDLVVADDVAAVGAGSGRGR